MNQQPATTYWDVFPKLIRVSTSDQLQEIPLSLRGDVEAPLFFSSNTMIADVGEAGVVTCGMQPGAAVLIVCRSEAFDSIRYVQVEVYGAPVISEGLPT
jgi:hypothetical protein